MILESLSVTDFRNLSAVSIAPHPRFNVFVGANGQGKTNLLDAVHVLATLRSLRGQKNRELIRHGEKSAFVEGDVRRGASLRRAKVRVAANGKRVWLNGNPVRELNEWFGGINVVSFAPDDVRVLRSSPGDRRLFLDRAIFALQPAYSLVASEYEQVVKQRNSALRAEVVDYALIDIYDRQLAVRGAEVVERRLRFVREISPRLQESFGAIFDEHLGLEMRYECGFAREPEGADLIEALLRALRSSRVRDEARGFTTVGPHRDDFVVSMAGQPMRAYASQGQHRAFVLAFKIAEIAAIEEGLGAAPILLLDDVSSELDPKRNERLFDFLSGFDGQVFITTTDAEFVRISGESQRWQVSEGGVI